MNSPTPPPPTETHPLRVLHVEDDPVDHRALLRLAQERHLPYKITWAESLAAARAQLAVQPFDLVITDYHLPDGEGPSLHTHASGPPFILVTGSLDEQLAVRTMEQGMDDYLVKDVERCYLAALPDAVTKARHRWEADEGLRHALDRLAAELAEQDHLNAELKRALAQVRTLRGLLPICAHCNKIRSDQGIWEQLETYVSTRTDVRFSHGICPECRKAHFPGFDDKLHAANPV